VIQSPKLKSDLTIVEAPLIRLIDKPRILLADNDMITSKLLTKISVRHGYEFVSVPDAREAYRVLKSDARFSVALFNTSTAHFQSLNILQYMKSEKRLMRIPVMIVIDEGGLKSIDIGFVARAIAFLSKPFTAEQLHRILLIALSQNAKELSAAE
jgi:DNA-binding NtrC family response regulator